jgi:hypothetical protein
MKMLNHYVQELNTHQLLRDLADKTLVKINALHSLFESCLVEYQPPTVEGAARAWEALALALR